MKGPGLPCPAERIVPHRGLMSFLTALDGIEPEASATADPSRNPMRLAGPEGSVLVDPLALAELAAQTCAAWNGWRNLTEGGAVRNGFLAGITRFDFLRPVSGSSPLRILVKEQTCIPPVTIVSARILEGKTLVAEGDLKVWEQEGEAPAGFSPTVDAADLPLRNRPLEPGELIREIGAACTGFRTTGTGAEGDYLFPRIFSGFEGHFPGFPLLPGVMILRTAAELAGRAAGRILNLSAVKRVKFGRPVLPGEPAVFTVSRRSDNEWEFSVSAGGAKAASGQLEFAP